MLLAKEGRWRRLLLRWWLQRIDGGVPRVLLAKQCRWRRLLRLGVGGIVPQQGLWLGEGHHPAGSLGPGPLCPAAGSALMLRRWL